MNAHTMVRASHLGAVPRGQEHQFCMLHRRREESLINSAGTELGEIILRGGVVQFDVFSCKDNLRHRLPRYVIDDCLVRSTIFRNGKGFFVAASVLEPLPEHPLYDPEAVIQLYFEAHPFIPGNPNINPDHIMPPDIRQIEPFMGLGRINLGMLRLEPDQSPVNL